MLGASASWGESLIKGSEADSFPSQVLCYRLIKYLAIEFSIEIFMWSKQEQMTFLGIELLGKQHVVSLSLEFMDIGIPRIC